MSVKTLTCNVSPKGICVGNINGTSLNFDAKKNESYKVTS